MPYVNIENGIQYYYEDRGEGTPIVFVHGWGMNRMVWERQAIDLCDKYRVITVDCRGCGNSSKPAHGYKISELADDLHQFMQELNLENAVLVGWSAGGSIVMDYVTRYGGRFVKKAVSVGGAVPRYTSAKGFELGFPQEAVEQTLAAMRVNRPALIRNIADGCFHQDVGQPMKDWFFNNFMEQSWFTEKTMEDLGKIDLRNRLRDITIPVAFFHGLHDGVVPLQLSEYSAREIAGAKLVVFENSSHAPFIEEIDRFNEELVSFIES
ncbi:alpha/beta fold hydrolase [Bacillus benzoevorans]|uniref:Pimeloyl-ACP methyl ester carboxylesterase n=1 Tax=Bacillus benzoevorans TaxID=1456 RepID=A0A7X0HTK0_9BACI|nr:alpha/beta hydrolase [Bacillus benzoevorans]MBB6446604.1 pimeloyl-ACP methyl ester carboxylesterase [Bacillus benzoevorans]